VLVGAIIAGGVLGYVASNGSESTQTAQNKKTPTVQANNLGLKEKPDDAGGKDFGETKPVQQMSNKRFSGRLGDDSQAAETQENASPETKLASAETESPNTKSFEERVDDVLASNSTESASQENSVSGDVNADRTVSTMDVSPDGTITEKPSGEKIGENARSYKVQVQETASSTETSKRVAADDVASSDSSNEDRPKQVASLTPEVTETSTGAFFVQVGARTDETQAQAAFAKIQKKYASVLEGMQPSIRKADLGAKGVWYRLRVGPVSDRDEGKKLCESLKAAGLKGCWTVKD
jgi:cell division protein FtsN